MPTSNELRQKRAKLIRDARELHELADKEERSLDAEQRAAFDKMMADADSLKGEYEAIERLEAAERSLDEPQERVTAPNKVAETRSETETPEDKTEAQHMRAFDAYLKHGLNGLEPVEYRALQADLDASGGYLRPPQQFVNQLIKFVDDNVIIRRLATKFRVAQAESMGAPSLDADPADANWTGEILTGQEDSTMAFGKRELTPHPLAKRIKISNKLLRVSATPAESLVRSRLAYKFAVTEEKAFLTGSGAQQPLGVFTASANGISTGQDVSTGNTKTAIGADNLRRVKYSLKEAYMNSGVWIFHRDAILQISLLKTGDGQYLWKEGITNGDPDRILGRPVYMSEFAPNTFTTGQYIGIFGDFSHYWIADAESMGVQRLVELYAETAQTGFIGRMDLDGMPVLEEAFARVTLA